MNALLAVGIFLVASFLADLALRFFSFHRDQEVFRNIRSYYPFRFTTSDGVPLGYDLGTLELSLAPQTVYFNRPGQHSPMFNINSFGMRGAEIKAKQPGKKRVLMLGASSAFGVGLPSDTDSIAQRLEDILEENEVLNGAALGFLSGQELAFLVTRGIDLRPDLVLLFDGWNDAAAQINLPSPEYGLGYASFSQIEGRLKDARPLFNRNALSRMGANMANAFFPELWARTKALWGTAPKRKASATDAAEVYARNIEKMKIISNSFGADFSCVFQPDARLSLPEEKWDYTARMYRNFLNLAEESLRARGIECLDMNQYRLGPEFFMDAIHFKPEGSRRAAAILAENIKQLRLATGAGLL